MGGHADREFEETIPAGSEDEALEGVADFLSAPGWYTIDYRRNIQAFWDGAMWSRTRRWRGVGWFEDDLESLLAPAASLEVVSRYPPASVVSPWLDEPSRRPPSLVRMRPERPTGPPAPVVARTNGLAVASFVLSLLGLLGVGSVLGIIFGFRARRAIRWSRDAQRGDRLALAGIIIGFATLVLFLVALTVGIIAMSSLTTRDSSAIVAAVGPPAQLSSQAAQTADLQCQADLRTVEVAVTAYWMDKGTYPSPPNPWSESTYKANYARLTSDVVGGPWLGKAPGADAYVVEFDARGDVWVAPAGTYEPMYESGQGFDAGAGACRVAVG